MDYRVTHWSAVRQSATGWRIVLLTSSAREVLESVLTPALIMWRQGGLHVVLVLIVKQLVIKLSVLVPRHIQETLLSLVVHLPRLTSAIPTPVAPMPSVSQEWTILQGRTGLCASVRMATEVME